MLKTMVRLTNNEITVEFNENEKTVIEKAASAYNYETAEEYIHDAVIMETKSDDLVIDNSKEAEIVKGLCKINNFANKLNDCQNNKDLVEFVRTENPKFRKEIEKLWQAIM